MSMEDNNIKRFEIPDGYKAEICGKEVKLIPLKKSRFKLSAGDPYWTVDHSFISRRWRVTLRNTPIHVENPDYDMFQTEAEAQEWADKLNKATTPIFDEMKKKDMEYD